MLKKLLCSSLPLDSCTQEFHTSSQEYYLLHPENNFLNCKIKRVPENMYTFSIVAYMVNVYKFSGTHFIY